VRSSPTEISAAPRRRASPAAKFRAGATADGEMLLRRAYSGRWLSTEMWFDVIVRFKP
jgi:hypothetical protein